MIRLYVLWTKVRENLQESYVLDEVHYSCCAGTIEELMHVGQIRLHPLIGLEGATFVANDWRQMGGEYFYVLHKRDRT